MAVGIIISVDYLFADLYIIDLRASGCAENAPGGQFVSQIASVFSPSLDRLLFFDAISSSRSIY